MLGTIFRAIRPLAERCEKVRKTTSVILGSFDKCELLRIGDTQKDDILEIQGHKCCKFIVE